LLQKRELEGGSTKQKVGVFGVRGGLDLKKYRGSMGGGGEEVAVVVVVVVVVVVAVVVVVSC